MSEDKEVAFIDTEFYGNAALFMCRAADSRTLYKKWITERDSPEADFVAGVMSMPYTFVSFRGYQYDLPMIRAIIDGRGPRELKHISNRIIEGNLMPWDVEREFKLPPHLMGIDHIDLEGVKPPFVGLKMCGARMGAPKILENPVDHNSDIDPVELGSAEEYCLNDLDLTEMLLKESEKPLLLRCRLSREYGIDLRSKTDSQVAEQVFIKRLRLARKRPDIPASVRYTPPAWAAALKGQELLSLVARLSEQSFRVHQGTGHVVMPDWLDEEVVRSRTGTYKVGVGGLHSTHDKKVCHVAGRGWKIKDIDVSSYYPKIIIEADPGILPPHLGQAFIMEYRDGFFYPRLAAKDAGDMSTADSGRIMLNGTFGKLMSIYSPLYAVAFGLYIVLTGQMGLLGTIAVLEEAGAEILSANTDGIVFRYRDEDEGAVDAAIAGFSELTGFRFEGTPYRCIAMKDVNNYVAVKEDRSIKAKGLYGKADLKKNPLYPVCNTAVGEWLAKGTPFAETIKAATKLTDFMAARNVTGGARQGEAYVGKVVRWYMTKDQLPPLTYVTNGNKVPRTEGTRACMVFDPAAPLPPDLNYSEYLKTAIRIAKDIGAGAYLAEEELKLVLPKDARGRPPGKKASKKAVQAVANGEAA